MRQFILPSTGVAVCFLLSGPVSAQGTPDWHLVYTPSHRATFEQQWKYTFPKHQSTEWFIALRYPPRLAWSTDVEGNAELLTSAGWKPFKEVTEESKEKRRMLVIDSPRDDPKLRGGFTVRTTLTATIFDQRLEKGKPAVPIALIPHEVRATYLAATETFDFNKPNVKKWLDNHKMNKGTSEATFDFARRVYKELRLRLLLRHQGRRPLDLQPNPEGRHRRMRPAQHRRHFHLPGQQDSGTNRLQSLGDRQKEPGRSLLGGILSRRRRLDYSCDTKPTIVKTSQNRSVFRQQERRASRRNARF